MDRLLESQARELPMPDGGTRKIEAITLFWDRLDLYVEAQILTLNDLIGLARMSMASSGQDFADAIQQIVADHDNRIF